MPLPAHIAIADFRPRPGLWNGHLQTIAGNFLPRPQRLPPPTSELVDIPLPPEMRELPQAVALDRTLPSRLLCHCHWQPEAAAALTVILVHGLEGSSHSQYVLSNAYRMWRAGMNVVRMNMRNCGKTDALSPTLYHSGMSTDAEAVLRWSIARGSRRIVMAGYSMGGNLVLKAAGEMGTEAPAELVGVAAVSPPVDLKQSADALHLFQNRLYERRFLRSLRARYLRKVQLFPAVYRRSVIGRVRSIRDFDELVMTPHCGFAGADDYYHRAAAARSLDRLAVPTLVIHALDDPFIRLGAESREMLRTNPAVTLLEPAHGGHCAFIEAARPGYDGLWAERKLLEFAQERDRETGASAPARRLAAALEIPALC